jgi:hypothetical protein
MKSGYIFVSLIFIAIVGGGFYMVFRQNDSIAVTSTSENQAAEPLPPPPIFNKDSLDKAISDVVSSYTDLDIGVSVKAIKDESASEYNGDLVFMAASTNKVPVVIYALNQVEQGKVKLNTPIQGIQLQTHIERMLVDSNNESWEALIRYFGNNNIKAYLNDIGISTYYINNQNDISPNDAAKLLKLLTTEPLLNQEHQDLIINYMKIGTTGPLVLEENYTNIPHKAGWLDDRLHLIGYLNVGENGSHDVSFGIYSKTSNGSPYSNSSGTTLINTIIKTIESELQRAASEQI